MWIKVNNEKFWVVRIYAPIFTPFKNGEWNSSTTGYSRLVVKDRPEDNYTSVLDFGYGCWVQQRRHIIRLYNPDTVFTVCDYATLSMAYSTISTLLALEEL